MIIRSEPEFDKLLEQMRTSSKYAIDTEGVIGIYPNYSLVGISISFDGRTGYYIPIGHKDRSGNNLRSGQLPKEFVVGKLKPFFEDPNKIDIMHNSSHDMKVFRVVDPTIEFPEESAFCTMTASFILNVNNEHNLKACALREFNHTMITLEEVCKKEKNKVTGDTMYRPDLSDIDELAPYAIDDAVQTYRLYKLYESRIRERGFEKIFYELEMPLMFELLEMEESGVLLNKEKLDEFMEDAPRKLEQLYNEIQSLLPSDEPVNLNSNPQMNEVLFNKMGIKPLGPELKSGGHSVKNDFLDIWATEHRVCGLISEYRRLSKLFGTYLKNLSTRVCEDGRIRCNFNRHVAKTGRLSSSKPNLQNIPRPENDIYGLRRLFMAPPGKKLVVADYSQVELRVEAHLSKDPTFIEAYQKGEDIHALTAKAIFKLPEPVDEIKDVHPAKRSIAKNVNFGIIYEAGVKTLTATANKGLPESEKVSEEEMKTIQEEYFKRFPTIRNYIDSCHKKAKKDGYVKTIIGRVRPLPDAQLNLQTKDGMRRMYGAFRQASNTPTQGSAGDILAIAMRNVRRRLKEEGLSKKTILQVHDEVVYEIDADISFPVAGIVKEEMENAVKLRVPLVADVSVGDIWGEIK